jgi:hypothetical protein
MVFPDVTDEPRWGAALPLALATGSAMSYFACAKSVRILERRNAGENLDMKVAHRIYDATMISDVNAALCLLLHRSVQRIGIREFNERMVSRELRARGLAEIPQ